MQCPQKVSQKLCCCNFKKCS